MLKSEKKKRNKIKNTWPQYFVTKNRQFIVDVARKRCTTH